MPMTKLSPGAPGFPRRLLRPVALLALSVCAATLAPPLAAQGTEKAKAIGKRMMCLCGCNQILTECNHVGCSTSSEMLRKLDQQVARNEPEDLTIQAFIQEYGQRVLAEPPARGFGLVAWAMPVIATLLGFAVVVLLIRRWQRPAVVAAGPDISPEQLARIRRQADLETEE